MKRVLAVFLTVALSAGLLAGCGNGTVNEQETSKKAETAETTSSAVVETIIENQESYGNEDEAYETGFYSVTNGITSDPNTFTPWGSGGSGRNAVTSTFYEPLAYLDTNGKLVLILAKSMTRVENCEYDIEIYDYIEDRAGNHMTASDVVFSFNKVKELGKYSSDVSCIDSVEATGDYTVRFHLKEDVVGGFYKGLNAVMVVTEAAWNSSPDGMEAEPIGTARYELKEYVPGTSFTAVRRDTYWQKEELCGLHQEGYTPEIKYDIITEKAQIAIALQSGEVTVSSNVETVDYVNFLENNEAKEGYNAYPFLSSHLVTLLFNCSESSQCYDENLRKAIATCIDCASLAESAFGSGLGFAATTFARPDMEFFDEKYNEVYNATDGGYYYYNLSKAEEYLKASNYDGSELLLICTKGNATRTTICTLIQAYCAAIGINVKFQIYEKAMYDAAMSASDPTSYDMSITFDEAVGNLYFILKRINMMNFNGDVNAGFFNDEVLQEKIMAYANVSTYSQETFDDLMSYMEDKCYQVALMYYQTYIITDDSVIGLSKNSSTDIMPGSIKIKAQQ